MSSGPWLRLSPEEAAEYRRGAVSRWRASHPGYGREWRLAHVEHRQQYHLAHLKLPPLRFCLGCAAPLPLVTGRGRPQIRCESCTVVERNRRRRVRRIADPEVARARDRRYGNPASKLARWHKRRALKQTAFVSDVDLREVYDRCRGRCHICGRGVPWELRGPDPCSKSIDHLIPLSQGGTHEPANVALAHLGCNSSRGPGRKPAQLWLLVQ